MAEKKIMQRKREETVPGKNLRMVRKKSAQFVADKFFMQQSHGKNVPLSAKRMVRKIVSCNSLADKIFIQRQSEPSRTVTTAEHKSRVCQQNAKVSDRHPRCLQVFAVSSHGTCRLTHFM